MHDHFKRFTKKSKKKTDETAPGAQTNTQKPEKKGAAEEEAELRRKKKEAAKVSKVAEAEAKAKKKAKKKKKGGEESEADCAQGQDLDGDDHVVKWRSLSDHGLDKTDDYMYQARKVRYGLENLDLARQMAERNVRGLLQSGIEEVPHYKIPAHGGEKALHKLVMKRFARFCDICSTKIFGKPITPPRLESRSGLPEHEFTYQIVEIFGRTRRGQQSSVYLLFIENNIFKEPVGDGSLQKILDVLSEYTLDNYETESVERGITLQLAALLLSEIMRLGALQITVKQLLKTGTRRCLPEFRTLVTEWGVMGRCGMQHECGNKKILGTVERSIPKSVIPDLRNPKNKEEFSNWKLFGRQRRSNNKKIRKGKALGLGLLVTLYDPQYTLEYMVHEGLKKPDKEQKASKKKIRKNRNKSSRSKQVCKPQRLGKASNSKLTCEAEEINTAENDLRAAEGTGKHESHEEDDSNQVVDPDGCNPEVHEDEENNSSPNKAAQEETGPEKSHNRGGSSIALETLLDGAPLTTYDLDSISGENSWLTDNAIGFLMAAISTYLYNEEVQLVHPAMSLYLMNNPGLLAAQNFSARSLVLLPINTDQFDPERGGYHWSLLVIDNRNRGAPRFIHHDSMRENTNFDVAVQVTRVMQQHIPDFVNATLFEADTPIQKGSDCGIWVYAVSEFICEWYTQTDGDDSEWVDSLMERYNYDEYMGPALREKGLATGLNIEMMREWRASYQHSFSLYHHDCTREEVANWRITASLFRFSFILQLHPSVMLIAM
ncbi:hypothetical protein EJB05_18588 [Eragrostis curvula]|uniref:Ubiquitin-like protease family profile domain-containing protein n=1 Tax=Eragrostis curvula TaxID=38414 RepID=A0A5J9VMF2_9POAL|nr:hypothetical protein EJB05_18588 [Eragrostis curvula]